MSNRGILWTYDLYDLAHDDEELMMTLTLGFQFFVLKVLHDLGVKHVDEDICHPCLDELVPSLCRTIHGDVFLQPFDEKELDLFEMT